MSKSVKLAQRVNLQVLGEAFNLANHVNVTGINNTGYIIGGTSVAPTLTSNAPFGSVTNANSNFAYSRRQIRIGAKLSF